MSGLPLHWRIRQRLGTAVGYAGRQAFATPPRQAGQNPMMFRGFCRQLRRAGYPGDRFLCRVVGFHMPAALVARND